MRKNALALSLLLLPALAQAEGPSRGIRLPFPAVSLGDDALGVEVNPGGLGFLRGFDAQLVASRLDDGVPGDGQGLFLAAPIVGPLSLGLGIEHLGLQTLSSTLSYRDYARLSLSAAVALGSRWSFGLTYHKQFGDAPGI